MSGKFYIGVHNNTNPDYLGSGAHLKNAIKKYGKENFRRETLSEGTREEVLALESNMVTAEFVRSDDTYNVTLGGGIPPSMKGVPQSDEHKQKISKALMGKQNFLGQKHSEERLKQISKVHKGKIVSQETRDKLSKAHANRVWSDEFRKKISKLFLGKKTSHNYLPSLLQIWWS